MPVVGDVVRVPGWRINVVGMEGRRVDRLRFVPDPESCRRTAAADVGDSAGTRPAGPAGRMPSAGGSGEPS